MTNITERKRLDPARTRDTILAAAREAFAAKGFDGASFADIAAIADVPRSLLQYHFGSKESLWKACLDQVAAPLVQPLDQFLANPTQANMETLVAARFQILHDNPNLVRMLAWASLRDAPLPEFLEQRRAQFRHIGGPDTGIDLTRLLFALAAMDGWFLYQRLYAYGLGGIALEKAHANRFLDFLIQAMQLPDASELSPNREADRKPEEESTS